MLEIITAYDKRRVSYSLLRFSGGELQPKITGVVGKGEDVQITAKMTCADDIMELILVVDALRRTAGREINIHLVCPYLPYARQDRVCAPGESLALKVMCDILNSLEFDSVTVADVHSDVALALLNNVRHVTVDDLIRDKFPLEALDNTILVAPDAGAIKKVHGVAKRMGLPMVRADKIRDPNTGDIKETVVYSQHVGDKNFLIVDDICDGGRTFLELAKVLRPLTNGKLMLYVTHGIFSKGIAELVNVFDHIYTAYPFPEANWTCDRYTVLR